MSLLKLTQVANPVTVWIASDKIMALAVADNTHGGNMTDVRTGDGFSYRVIETPEQIAAMIAGPEPVPVMPEAATAVREWDAFCKDISHAPMYDAMLALKAAVLKGSTGA